MLAIRLFRVTSVFGALAEWLKLADSVEKVGHARLLTYGLHKAPYVRAAT